jgi:heavy metal sensor kinase
MTLVNRVSAFFLVALAVVLAACSALFYGVVRGQLMRQFEEQLYSALHSLAAAVEVEPDEVKWQPAEHAIGLGVVDGPEQVRWAVIGDDAQVVETSHNASKRFIGEATKLARQAPASVTDYASPELVEWRFLHQRLTAAEPVRENREPGEFDTIVVVVARSTGRLDSSLDRLAAFAAAVPAAGWIAAAALGRWFCRRALEPVLSMARNARSMSGDDFRSRLPLIGSGDELAELGVAFNTLLDRLQLSFEAQRRFTGDAAHELRTPLTVLRGQIDVALRKSRSGDEYRDTLDVLRAEAGELHEILESLLFLARADHDALAPEAEAVELRQWLQEYMKRWSDHSRAEELEVEAPHSADAVVSPALLTRLLDNLIGNAIKYSPAGSPVVVRLSREGAEVVLSVSDRGPGLSSEEARSIFEPFYRTSSARSSGAGGSGLGLAIAARIAQVFHGRIECESGVGRGSTFSVHLPAP